MNIFALFFFSYTGMREKCLFHFYLIILEYSIFNFVFNLYTSTDLLISALRIKHQQKNLFIFFKFHFHLSMNTEIH